VAEPDPGDAAGARRLLCELGDHLRDLVVEARAGGAVMDEVVGATPADTIYGADAITEAALLGWFERRWPGVEVVSEGLDGPVAVGSPAWTVIVDPVDGTRGLMHDKRSAWSLAAAAPHGGRSGDIVAAAMTEIPTTKQWAADQLSAVRGGGVVAERVDVVSGGRRPLAVRPSSATDLEHGFAQLAKFFPAGKAALAAIEEALLERLGAEVVFDDQYLASGGQLHELVVGHDRFVADLRPLVAPGALACHPYDVCCALVLEEAGGVVTDPWGAPLDVPLDTTTGVAWAGYANRDLAERIGPVLAAVLHEHLGG
jgi:fructose-1,6-bisphosphatase/inositol monophosphatase family enzyme